MLIKVAQLIAKFLFLFNACFIFLSINVIFVVMNLYLFCHLLNTFTLSFIRPIKYEILTSFDNKPIDHTPTTVQLDVGQFGNLNVSITSDFFGGAAPPVPTGASYSGLWLTERTFGLVRVKHLHI